MGKPLVIVIFGSPYLIHDLTEGYSTIVMAYQDDPLAQIAAAELIMGKIPPKGKLPIK